MKTLAQVSSHQQRGNASMNVEGERGRGGADVWYAPFSLERDLMKIFTQVHLISIEVIHLLMLRGRGGGAGRGRCVVCPLLFGAGLNENIY